jgi:hypothetical protein
MIELAVLSISLVGAVLLTKQCLTAMLWFLDRKDR